MVSPGSVDRHPRLPLLYHSLGFIIEHSQLAEIGLVLCDVSKVKNVLSLNLPLGYPVRHWLDDLLHQILHFDDVFTDGFQLAILK